MASEVLIEKVRDEEISGVRTWGPTSADASWVFSCYPDAIFIY